LLALRAAVLRLTVSFVGVAEYGDDLATLAVPFAVSYRDWQLPWRALDT
jgi:hypothetical protein